MAFGLATPLSAVGVFAGEHDQDQIEAFPALVVFFRYGPSQPARLLGGLPTILGLAAHAVRQYAPASPSTTSGILLANVATVASAVLAFVG